MTLYVLPSEAVIKLSLITEFSSNSFSFRTLAIWYQMFGTEVPKRFEICDWLSHPLNPSPSYSHSVFSFSSSLVGKWPIHFIWRMHHRWRRYM